jgi:hypothetical protein
LLVVVVLVIQNLELISIKVLMDLVEVVVDATHQETIVFLPMVELVFALSGIR